jgi:hypothetical protein
MRAANLKSFIGCEVFVIYLDQGQECTCFGKLLGIDDETVRIQTFHNVLILSAATILKVKISKPMEQEKEVKK